MKLSNVKNKKKEKKKKKEESPRDYRSSLSVPTYALW